jgi:hypothetical protein
MIHQSLEAKILRIRLAGASHQVHRDAPVGDVVQRVHQSSCVIGVHERRSISQSVTDMLRNLRHGHEDRIKVLGPVEAS